MEYLNCASCKYFDRAEGIKRDFGTCINENIKDVNIDRASKEIPPFKKNDVTFYRIVSENDFCELHNDKPETL